MSETEPWAAEKEAARRLFARLAVGQVWDSTEHHRRPRSVVVYRTPLDLSKIVRISRTPTPTSIPDDDPIPF